MTLSWKRLSMLLGALIASFAFAAVPASAQATRTWVSGVGDDVNPCSRTAPCKTFAGAISKTAAGGEINCLDPGGFGTVTITKSITIDCTATLGSVLNSATTGIIINNASAVVVLRGLTINGGTSAAPGLYGIRFIAEASLTVENVVIQNQIGASPNGHGIFFQPSGPAELFVTNSLIVDNGAIGGGSGSGIEIAPQAGGSASVTIASTRILNGSTNGIRLATASGAATATIRDTTISGNANGVVIVASANPGVALLVDSTVSGNSGFGILTSGAAARARVSNTAITANGTGVNALGGPAINSFGNNQLVGNGTDGTFTPPNVSPL